MAVEASAGAPPGAIAGDHVVVDVPRAAPETPAADARAALAGRAFATVTEVAVLEGERLLGLVPIERLLAAPGGVAAGALAEACITTAPDADLEVVTRLAARRGARTVAVVGGDGRFVGLVPPQRLLALLEREHEEDMARLGGFLTRASLARTASEESVRRRLWHRLPWLALGLLGAMASAAIVGAFEEQLRKQVLLAFFVPAVVYMADAVGTQTETLVIRGMSVGVSVRDTVGRELLSGLVIGLLVGAVFFPFALAVWGDARVAGSVAIALVVSCSVATVVALVLPALLARLGQDPAFGSGPLATVVQDLLTIAAYFGVAILLAP
ncbi:MAG TPA: magnesium transporter [Gaiellaceae bacterium]|nr:magnesium transporter [Gaiellaceae bacterium]